MTFAVDTHELFAREAFVHGLENSIVLELDATTNAKFSRHVIIRTPGWAFRNTAAVGSFVQSMLRRRPGQWMKAVDMSVYSRCAFNCN